MNVTRRGVVDPRTLTAYHEAGHAVLSAAINDAPHHVSIRADGHTLGRSGARMSAGPASLAQVHLAGFAAEHVLTRRRPRQLDREVKFALVARIDQALLRAFEGSERRDGHRAVCEVLKLGLYDADEDIKREVDRLYEIAHQSLTSVWPAVVSVAEALLLHEELDREGFESAIGEHDIYSPILRVQREHSLVGLVLAVAEVSPRRRPRERRSGPS